MPSGNLFLQILNIYYVKTPISVRWKKYYRTVRMARQMPPLDIHLTRQYQDRQQETRPKSGPPSTERDERQNVQNIDVGNYILNEISKRINCNLRIDSFDLSDEVKCLKIINHEICCRAGVPAMVLSSRMDFTPYLKQHCTIFTIHQQAVYFLVPSSRPYKILKITHQSETILTKQQLQDTFQLFIVVPHSLTNQYHTDLPLYSLQISKQQQLIIDYHGQFTHSLKRIVIFKKIFNGYQFVAGDFAKDYHLAVNTSLDPGEYIVYCTMNHNQNIVIYSQQPVQIAEIQDISKQLFFSILVENVSTDLILYERTLMLKIGLVIELFRNRSCQTVEFRCENMEQEEKQLLFEDDYYYRDGLMTDKNQLIRIFLINDVPVHLVTPRVTIIVDGSALTTHQIQHFQN